MRTLTLLASLFIVMFTAQSALADKRVAFVASGSVSVVLREGWDANCIMPQWYENCGCSAGCAMAASNRARHSI